MVEGVNIINNTNQHSTVSDANGKFSIVASEESNIEQLGYFFEEEYYIDYLKIPSEYVRGFKFYLVENQQVKMLLKENDKSKLTLLMSELALKYNEIISSENK